MGFKKPQKTANLKYEGTDYEGAEVTVSLSVSLGTFFEIERLRTEGNTQEWMRQFVENCVLSWNLEEEDGKPTPVTFEGFTSWPPEFAMLTVQAWIEAVTPDASPLPTNGTTEDEEMLDLANFSKPA